MPDDNPRVRLGANFPPADDPYDAFDTHVSDLLLEARNHLDGEGVQTQGQADAMSALLEQARKVAKDADAARAAEKKPHDDAARAVQARWKPLLERCDLMVSTCKDALAPWLRKLEEETRAAAEAAAAIQAAHTGTDLAAREAAKAKLAEAHEAQTAAARAANGRAQAKGGARATSLRTYYRPELTDPKAALKHYASERPDDLKACLLRFAEQDVQAGKRQVPGFDIVAKTRVV